MNQKYMSCGNVFNVTMRDNKIRSECVFGVRGAADAASCSACEKKCETCNSYVERDIRMQSVDISQIEQHKAKMLKVMLEDKNRKKKINNHSYLYNDVMIHSEDKNYFDAQCKEKLSKKSKKDNKKEGKKVNFTDIY